jgi:hypothetical protein
MHLYEEAEIVIVGSLDKVYVIACIATLGDANNYGLT